MWHKQARIFGLLRFFFANSEPVSRPYAAMMGLMGVSHPGGTCESRPSISLANEAVVDSKTCVFS